jgi:hypothetical protein
VPNAPGAAWAERQLSGGSFKGKKERDDGARLAGSLRAANVQPAMMPVEDFFADPEA